MKGIKASKPKGQIPVAARQFKAFFTLHPQSGCPKWSNIGAQFKGAHSWWLLCRQCTFAENTLHRCGQLQLKCHQSRGLVGLHYFITGKSQPWQASCCLLGQYMIPVPWFLQSKRRRSGEYIALGEMPITLPALKRFHSFIVFLDMALFKVEHAYNFKANTLSEPQLTSFSSQHSVRNSWFFRREVRWEVRCCRCQQSNWIPTWKRNRF